MDSNVFSQILQNLEFLKSAEQLKTACEEFCLLLGIPYYLMGIVSPDSLNSPSMNVLSNYPEEWLDSYFKQNKQKDDPVVAYMMNKHAPVEWNQLLQLSQFNNAQSQSFMLEAKEYGLKNGLSIPIRSSLGKFAVFSLAIDDDSEAGKRKLNDILPFAHTFGVNLFERQINITSEESIAAKLTNRETECLFWACEGKTAWEISQIVDITERTVLFHLNNSTKKLGATNRQHAVSLAMRYGIVTPNLRT
ncbi:LuxR family transcriptional regulator [Shewanella sp. KX20019]|uniref:LuxR family transcriptional regulator n=1 Tax=Shewanella sp. KX20019 TaxID=2803864 RepID=UPI0019296352|nr:LuxR family transcriptional regulator [Shewanella sp. KX20019]QQX80929.1 LuxR family transcriptional regulator [Shewanella sp. KX20019]